MVLLSIGLTRAGSFGREALQADAGAPPALNYQGFLTDADTGEPVADGDYEITFKIYDDATSVDPDRLLWEETHLVSVTGGLFNVILGTVTSLEGTWVDGRDLWLGITVTGESEMTPRQQLVSVPYALNAGDVRGADIHPASVYAVSTGTAIRGEATGSGYIAGVYGTATSNNGVGVHGHAFATGSAKTAGVYGTMSSDEGFGVAGYNWSSGVGVGAWSWDGNLIEAYDGGYPYGTRRFWVDQAGEVWAYGWNQLSSLKSGDARAFQSVGSPEAWFEDFGRATLVDGRAVVTIEPLFAQTVNLELDYHVFVTPLGDCRGLYITDQTPTSFEVRELGGGTANISFDYRIVAKRLGLEQVRMPRVNVERPVEAQPRPVD